MHPPTITLTVFHGCIQVAEYVCPGPSRFLIGRAEDCDIQLPPDSAHLDVSRHHCLLDIDPPAIRVRDLGSLNGTFINGVKIGQRPRHLPREATDLREFPAWELHDGDQLQIGTTVIRVGLMVPGDILEPMYYV